MVVSKKTKKTQESINNRLALVMKSGKYTLGYKTVLRSLRGSKSKLIIISNNCPPLRKSEIEYYAMLSKVGVHHFNGNNVDLGTACGKYFRVCCLSIIDPALAQQRVSIASDMWSLGVILYILLSGYPPFHAPSNREKQQRILAGDFSFDEHTWKTITSSAKQLISSLLSVDPSRRPTAKDLLQHPWVIGDSAKQELMDAEVVSRLQSFNARRKLRAAAIASVWSSKVFLRTKKLKSLIGTHDLSSDELENLRLHFKRICADGDNATLPEFEEVLKAMKMDSLILLAPRVFDLFDNNRDGTVDMRELLCGLSSLKNSQGDDALQICFQMYDTDRSGSISKEELASMLRALPEDCLPADITEPGKLDEIFDQMDANNDGKVSFDEFKAAMQRDSSLQDVVMSSLRPQ
ncbi:hypothetical protein J5N97_014556 [Dioscorea zingiberensis]|uniref:Uncharacterized protein n=1 Tax=Dioscorea zingiberensis TaxID=325984 RepID=A0A9D5HK67_9LILI|nr:hypothetical protein J5N97_014556 [Dioscorea zingiberensis]